LDFNYYGERGNRLRILTVHPNLHNVLDFLSSSLSYVFRGFSTR
jgi:hypothetical protein